MQILTESEARPLSARGRRKYAFTDQIDQRIREKIGSFGHVLYFGSPDVYRQ